MVLAQQVIAHRGASFNAPENTLAAFRLAWQQGADGIEGDFYLTDDGEIVCLHDSDTGRTGDRKLSVGQSTLEQLRTVDVGISKGEKFRGERIPTLAEVLAVVPAGQADLHRSEMRAADSAGPETRLAAIATPAPSKSPSSVSTRR